jgi:hypothetical protein
MQWLCLCVHICLHTYLCPYTQDNFFELELICQWVHVFNIFLDNPIFYFKIVHQFLILSSDFDNKHISVLSFNNVIFILVNMINIKYSLCCTYFFILLFIFIFCMNCLFMSFAHFSIGVLSFFSYEY